MGMLWYFIEPKDVQNCPQTSASLGLSCGKVTACPNCTLPKFCAPKTLGAGQVYNKMDGIEA